VIGVGSPRARKEGGDRRQPSRRAVSAPPQPPPDNVDIAGSGAPETSKDGQGMATGARTEKHNGRSAQDAGPKNRQPKSVSLAPAIISLQCNYHVQNGSLNYFRFRF